MLKRIAKFLARRAEDSTFEGYYRQLLNSDTQVAPTADEARRDYRQALYSSFIRHF